MQLLTSATQIDYYPQGDGKHRFTKRVIWHPDAECDQQMTSFSTVLKVEMKYQVRNYCLLYTSPSPRDATLSRMPSSA